MIEITEKPLSPGRVLSKMKTDDSGCVVIYAGLIRDRSQGKPVVYVEYEDIGGKAEKKLQEIASEIKQKWPINNIAICHRIGKLKVGEINLVVAIASAHRKEGFAACQYAIDQFKQKLPTLKKETYRDSSVSVEE